MEGERRLKGNPKETTLESQRASSTPQTYLKSGWKRSGEKTKGRGDDMATTEEKILNQIPVVVSLDILDRQMNRTLGYSKKVTRKKKKKKR